MIPPKPANSFRIVLELAAYERRLDSVLMKAFRDQTENEKLHGISRAEFKQLFKEKRVLIKDQPANASSALAAGTTYIDILGY